MFVISNRIERYFLLDHGRQVMLIYKTNDLNQGATASIDYGSMISIIEPEAKIGQLMERWGFGFRLETKERWFQLFAVCEDEYKLWVHTIKWILHRNRYSRLFKNGVIENKLSGRSAKKVEKTKPKVQTDEEDTDVRDKTEERKASNRSGKPPKKHDWASGTEDEEVKKINNKKQEEAKKKLLVKKESIRTLLD